MTFRQRTSNVLHRLAHRIDSGDQPLCPCKSLMFVAGIKARRPSSPVAHSPEELRAYIAASEAGVDEGEAA